MYNMYCLNDYIDYITFPPLISTHLYRYNICTCYITFKFRFIMNSFLLVPSLSNVFEYFSWYYNMVLMAFRVHGRGSVFKARGEVSI